MSDTIKTKRCAKCKEIKESCDFHKNKSRHNGLSDYCKNCTKQYNQSIRGKQAQRRYFQTTKGKQRYKRYGKNNPEKTKARYKVNYAIKSGKLLPARHYWCACGKQAEQYHHHLGYEPEHQFDVIPVCRKDRKSVV